MKPSLHELSNTELADQLQRLVRREREATATLVAHLAEFKKRKLYLGEGYGSMFQYCTRVLHLSEHATYLRLEAARIAVRFPKILTALESGDLNLTAVRLLSPHLNEDNFAELVAAARHRTRVEIEVFLAQRFPRPDVAAVVRKLPAKAPMSTSAATANLPLPAREVASADLAPSVMPAAAAACAATHAPRRDSIQPLAPERYKIQFTASAATQEKLRRAQDLLRHRIPKGDLSQVFDLALEVLIARLEKSKLAATDRPRSGHGTQSGARPVAEHSRTIPAAVKRVVWKRDGGRCAFIGKSQHRCDETGFLEFHHVMPFARGGAATASNIQLRCRAPNRFEAELEFGPWKDLVRESSATWMVRAQKDSVWTESLPESDGGFAPYGNLA